MQERTENKKQTESLFAGYRNKNKVSIYCVTGTALLSLTSDCI